MANSTSVLRVFLRGLTVLAVLAVGVLGARWLAGARKPPARAQGTDRGVLVRTAKVRREAQQSSVSGQGVVLPARQVALAPQVSGRVLWVHPRFQPGARFRRGEVLVRIDERDYALAARQAAAQVAAAELELKVETARKDIAETEWEIIGRDLTVSPEGRSLVLREPQREAVAAQREAAVAGSAAAQLALSRTVVVAPFDGFVQTKGVDEGQLVGPTTALGTFIGSEEFWVQVSVPVSVLPELRLPGIDADEGDGSAARVWMDAGEERIERPGRVVRLLGDLDPLGRMARLLVAVEQPLDPSEGSTAPGGRADRPASSPSLASSASHDGAEGASGARASSLPLLLGAYVNVALDGVALRDVVEVPRSALREGQVVHVLVDGRLQIRPVEVVARRADSVLVGQGLSDGDELVLSRIPTATPGMKLRAEASSAVAGSPAPAPDGAAAR